MLQYKSGKFKFASWHLHAIFDNSLLCYFVLYFENAKRICVWDPATYYCQPSPFLSSYIPEEKKKNAINTLNFTARKPDIKSLGYHTSLHFYTYLLAVKNDFDKRLLSFRMSDKAETSPVERVDVLNADKLP